MIAIRFSFAAPLMVAWAAVTAPSTIMAQPAAQPKAKSYEVPASRIPKELMDEAEKHSECSREVMAQPATALDISPDKAVWEIACGRFAYQTSSVFVLVSIKDPAKNPIFLTFSAPRGKKRGAFPHILMNAELDDTTREISSANFGRGMRDCGTFEVHRILSSGKLKLIEYREKARCNGKFLGPEEWPLVFKAK